MTGSKESAAVKEEPSPGTASVVLRLVSHFLPKVGLMSLHPRFSLPDIVIVNK